MLASGAAEDPSLLVLARAKAAIPAGDRTGALALLHVLLTEGAEAAAALTPVLAEALIATARAEADDRDRQARQTYQESQNARAPAGGGLARTLLGRAAVGTVPAGAVARGRAQADEVHRQAPEPVALDDAELVTLSCRRNACAGGADSLSIVAN